MTPRRTHVMRVAVLVVSWLVVAVPAMFLVTANSAARTVLAGHEAVVRPTLDGWTTFDLGPYLPAFRHSSGSRVGAAVDMGKTTVHDYDRLIDRYATIAAQPESQIAKLRSEVRGVIGRGVATGAVLGLAGPGLVLLVGDRRWREMANRVSVRRAGVAGLAVAVVVAGLAWMFPAGGPPEVEQARWQPLQETLPSIRLPAKARGVQVDRSLLTTGTARLVQSAVDSYRASFRFYNKLQEKVATIGPELRQPQEGETVALLVSDRHDNVNMDPVAREVAEQGGATMLLNAGDDTSSGSAWEGFSLESLDKAFEDFDHRYSVAGNHDHGDFVTATMRELGFTTLDGEPVEGPDGIRLLGAADPRSSGLGAWLDERRISMSEQTDRLADVACEEDQAGRRIGTLLVHDGTAGEEALARGCVDLVLSGHRHEQVGPEPVVGSNGRMGYRYVTGTTGGAAYAIALGSKLRRNAHVTLVTYRDGRPIGLQPVTLRTVGDIQVGAFIPLDLNPLPPPTGPVPVPGAEGN